MRKRAFLQYALTCTLTAAIPLTTHANTTPVDVASYPSKPVTIIVGFSVGGPTDSITRMLADLLGKHFKQPFIVENKLGGNGTVAAQQIKSAKPDGYTLFLGGSGTLVVAPNLNPKVPYNTFKDFTPIARVSDYPYFLVVPASSSLNSIKELIAAGKDQSKSINYASAGMGSGNHLATEWFVAETGVKAVHIPYKGDTAALADVLTGRVDFAFLSGVSIDAHVKSGKLRVLGVSSLRDDRADKNVPLVATDADIKDYAVEPWTGIFGPADMPPELVQKISQAINQVMQEPETKSRLTAIGQFPFPGSSGDFSQYIQSEYARWTHVVKNANIQMIEN